MQLIALIFIGFSIGSATLLMVGNSLQPVATQRIAQAAGCLLLIGLAGLQFLHLGILLKQFDAFHSPLYPAMLYGIAPSFYFYSRQILLADSLYQQRDLYHAAPIIFSLILPQSIAVPVAFLIGSGYLLWLAQSVYALREQRQRFRLELMALATLFAIAIGVVLLGFIWPLLSEHDFIVAYSILIGMAFFAATLTLLRFPTITADVSEAVQAAYAESTLKHIDKAAVLAKLDRLMRQDKLYTLETLNLPLLAEQLDLSQHQLSELINTQFQQGFSRYIREQRIQEAKRLLLAEPHASVLAIGLSVGFSTQSNFYAAFRDIVGMAPGQYRKNHA
ncbi:MAG: helix-turn-helix domain-containing protein [Methylovulum miyakonense]|uniref:helix-turn-helix domain-containing protein n=1 Tax=Methylovulum miyakonense TaxID=645578 RepID=UPI003BB4C655